MAASRKMETDTPRRQALAASSTAAGLTVQAWASEGQKATALVVIDAAGVRDDVNWRRLEL